ncbi:outer membrane lipoprotein-sorting protein [Cesiribacter andamanensis]|uniref:Outer membrane lipoprotein-sorting protein n=1 Tax=Cesiribacter andamanensis AMV16 TaxID=1279009 RepID=M7NJK5_9BACT|nr:outer membrane lipoprotein-sorting protein [Cesiribacter andamanensis]EMR01980.1 Outer membrane lipoprotein-sorting protein [Cesiribacter andamanensis AMV16]
MKTFTTLLALLLLATGPLTAQTATEIVRLADEKMKGESSIGTFTMEIVRPSWKRSISMKSWTRGTDYSLTLITAPAAEKGKAFLMRQNEIWNWVPTVDRVIKLPPSMMMQSWMGSDFTNDDLVKQSSIVTDYTHTLVGEEKIEGREAWIIELRPRPDAPVVWGKIRAWITKGDYLQLKAEYYDEDDFLINTLLASQIKTLGGREIPSRLEMIPDGKPGHKTVLIYREIQFNQEIPDSFFSLQNLKRVQ